MESRIEGVQRTKAHLYSGKNLLGREVFYTWALEDPGFQNLYAAWESAEFPRKLSPSVDRIDSSRGYELENMEWVTHSENSRRGALSRHGKTPSSA